MSETSIAEPLTGAEVIEAIVYRVKEQLRKDCFLSANCAYETFMAKILIQVVVKDVSRSEKIESVIAVNSGKNTGPGFPDEDGIISDRVYPEDPPNVIRRETEQPVPVLVEDGAGNREIKRVKYQKKVPKETENGAIPTE